MAAVKSTGTKKEKVTRGDRTRAKIKNTIMALAKKQDIASFTLQDICKAADVTTGAFYFHFKSREDAIGEMASDEFERLYQSMTDQVQGCAPEAMIRAVVSTSTEYQKSMGLLPRALQITINTNEAVHTDWIRARRPLVDAMEGIISAARSAKDLDSEPARYIAYYLLNALEDLGMDVFQWKNPALQRFAQTNEDWNQKQIKLWSWAIFAPF